ncbi:lipopolysaccharide transport periplasmic protein LptA [Nitratifractor sp.]
MRILLVLLAVLSWGWGDTLELKADRFTHLETEHKAIFEGHAHAIQGKSWVDADKLIVLTDADNNATEYRAVGNVRFEIDQPDQHIKGSCDKLIYKVAPKTYHLIGNAKIEDLLNKRTMEGEELFLDSIHKRATAKSDHKRPVKFIFEMKNGNTPLSNQSKH